MTQATRQIVLDTETTGLKPEEGHRIIEIAAVELIDRRFTAKHFHYYINPEREIESGAFAVHGISNQFLQDKPKFAEIYEEFLLFIKDAEVIIHNAPFDVSFINKELSLLKLDASFRWHDSKGKPLRNFSDHCVVFDTLEHARKLHPGQKNNLDALCKRYGVDNSDRNLHGALLDAKLLALVYLGMTGGQSSLFADDLSPATLISHKKVSQIHRKTKESLAIIKASIEELQAHQEYLAMLKKKSRKEVSWE